MSDECTAMRASGECCFSCEVFTLNAPLKRSTFFFYFRLRACCWRGASALRSRKEVDVARGKNFREFLQNKTQPKNSDGFILDINQTAEEFFFFK